MLQQNKATVGAAKQGGNLRTCITGPPAKRDRQGEREKGKEGESENMSNGERD